MRKSAYLLSILFAFAAPNGGDDDSTLAPPPQLIKLEVKQEAASRSLLNSTIEESGKESGKNATDISELERNVFPLYIRFLGWPQAVTSETAHFIVEGMDPTKLPSTALGSKGSSNAQILYEKIKQPGSAPLVSVLLMEGKNQILALYKDKFDMVAQQCSCYWIDIKDVASKVSILPNSDKYYLRFLDTSSRPPKFDARSGYFTINP